MGLGLSWLLASLGTLFRDISQIAGPLSLGTLFCSAVFYPVDQVPESIWQFLKFNPILHVVNELRSTLLWNESIDLGSLLYLITCGAATLILGWTVFYFTKSKLIEIV
jgi:ABC-type polysaccharide/polyol phosphate export permease